MGSMNPANISAEDLNDPTIDAETLRHIATERPDLRPVILRHPNCHAELANYIQNMPEGPTTGAGYGPYAGYSPQPPVSVSDEKTWGVLMHIGAIFFGFLVPLVVWLIYRERSRTLDQQGRTALNWQISCTIYLAISSILMVVLVGFVTMFAAIILNLIFCIIAAVNASDRAVWKYPLAIPFLQVGNNIPPQQAQYY